jgi:hypothetical protein
MRSLFHDAPARDAFKDHLLNSLTTTASAKSEVRTRVAVTVPVRVGHLREERRALYIHFVIHLLRRSKPSWTSSYVPVFFWDRFTTSL